MKKLNAKQKDYVVGLLAEYSRKFHGNAQTEAFLKEKGLIKEEFEVGKWYKAEYDNNIIICFQGKNKGSYGVAYDKTWVEGFAGGDLWERSPLKATDKEVVEVLIKEAKKQGHTYPDYYFYAGCLYGTNTVPYIDADKVMDEKGKWAETINNWKWAKIIKEEPIKDLTIEEVQKKFGCKVKIVEKK